MSKSNDDLLSDNNIDPHHQSGDLDFFTLLEENIALKEKIEDLTTKHNNRRALEYILASLTVEFVCSYL